ncbi:DUF6090 family protein [Fulvivirgaceae bacterium BMA10]|uniref:DUF6090 family protein n=1 Tax=Splendidivirga corallicola TaxID=3051826 RepID=A0ABT8KVJ3_9BACT|nr:DUF6090 family protein [Fulvivirgaceae bacterium BMA10]
MNNVNWRNHLIELFVVIVGITIAFSLNSWKESRKEQKLEKKYIQSFISDIDRDAEELARLRDTTSYFHRMNGGLTKVLVTHDYNHDSLFYYVISLYSMSTFLSQDNTYETLKASGNLEIISDFELKNDLTMLYNQHYKFIKFLDEIHERSIYDEMSPYINKNVRFTGRPVILNKEFLSDTYFINKSFSSYYFLNTKLRTYEDAIKKCEEILIKLKSELDS